MSADDRFVEIIRQAARVIVAVGGIIVVTRQVRKPAWFVGRWIVRTMNRSHAGLRAWALERIAIGPDATVLDVGCGGGATIAAIAAAGAGRRVFGVDFSDASVTVARETNARFIAEARVAIQPASVSALPFDADTFDVVTAFETHFYWPDLPADVKEIQRVLKPGGRVALVAEVYGGRSMDWLYRPAMGMLRAHYLTPDEHRELLTRAGYLDVDVVVERTKGWILATGRRPG